MVHICIFDATIQEFTDKGVDLVSTLKGLGYEAFVTNVLVPPHNVSNYGDVNDEISSETTYLHGTVARLKRRSSRIAINNEEKSIKGILQKMDAAKHKKGRRGIRSGNRKPSHNGLHKRKEKLGRSENATIKDVAKRRSVRHPTTTIVCNFPGCKTIRLRWSGIRDLKDHVRVHWGKSVLKCQHCDTVLLTTQRYYNHFRKYHEGERKKKMGFLETEQDRNELRGVWEQCFPDVAFR
ncbi:hypothetical protein RB195_005143 [Necator americanus]